MVWFSYWTSLFGVGTVVGGTMYKGNVVMRPLFALLLVLTFAATSRGGLILTFDAAVPGTLADKNGLGTGFTHRLPGTGASLPTNDPNMDLLSSPGRLLLTSTRADINQGNVSRNLATLEAPGVFLSSVGSSDISVSALFRSVSVPNPSDQLLLYVGVSSEKALRVGMHHSNIFILRRISVQGMSMFPRVRTRLARATTYCSR